MHFNVQHRQTSPELGRVASTLELRSSRSVSYVVSYGSSLTARVAP